MASTNRALSDAPARLRRELDSVLNLQAELDDIKKFVAAMQTHIRTENTNPQAHHFLRSLQQSHARTIEQVEALYASLNVPEEFPEIQGLSLPFVQTLIMARDLKINIRKRAIGSFFEWDKLDRAAGGRDQPLGRYKLPRVTIANHSDFHCRYQTTPADPEGHCEAHTGPAHRNSEVQYVLRYLEARTQEELEDSLTKASPGRTRSPPERPQPSHRRVGDPSDLCDTSLAGRPGRAPRDSRHAV